MLTGIALSEQDAWERFILSIQGVDAWHVPSFGRRHDSLDFSWGHHRQGARLLERLDRFYIGDWASEVGGSTCIWPRTSLSDHHPVSLCITFQTPNAPRRGCRIPSTIFRAPQLTDDISSLWSAVLPESLSPREVLAYCISSSSSLCRETTTLTRRALLQRERELSVPLSATRRWLQECPGDLYFTARQAELLQEIRSIQDKRSEFISRASASFWIAKADRMNKDFFNTHRERPSGTFLRAVRDSQGILQTQPDTVLAIASSYYEELFRAEPVTPEILNARDRVWRHTRHSVTQQMRDGLIAPFTMQELRDAVDSIDPSSCPGDDGLTRDFFQTYWDSLQEPLLAGCQDIFTSGEMPTSLSSGLISLIPKGGGLYCVEAVEAHYFPPYSL